MENEEKNGKKREEIALSSVSVSVILMVAMALPLLILLLMGAWTVALRLLFALLIGIFAVVYAKKADKLSVENDMERAVKAAKSVRGMNTFNIIYGIFSWIAFIRVMVNL